MFGIDNMFLDAPENNENINNDVTNQYLVVKKEPIVEPMSCEEAHQELPVADLPVLPVAEPTTTTTDDLLPVINLEDDQESTVDSQSATSTSQVDQATTIDNLSLVKTEPMDSEVLSQASSCVDHTRKRRLIDYQEPAPKYVKVDAVSFVKSDDDPTAVDIIFKHRDEFSTICDKYGFKLTMDWGFEVDVRLTQISPICNSRLAFKDMEKLIEKKLAEKENLRCQLEEITQELTIYKQKVEELMAEKQGKTRSKRERVQQQQEEKVDKVEEPQDESQVSLDVTSTSQALTSTPQEPPQDPGRRLPRRKSTHFDIDLESMKEDDKFIKYVCELLCREVKQTPANPFYQLKNFCEKKRIVKGYLDYVQHEMSPICYDVYIKVCQQFNDKWRLFAYQPTVEQIIAKRDKMKKRYRCYNDVIGCTCFIPYQTDNQEFYLLCLAVFEGRIVAWSTKATEEECLKKLRKRLRNSMDHFKDYKFVTEADFGPKLEDCFAKSKNKEMYGESRLVVKWLKDNFHCLQTTIYGYNHAALPAMFNLCKGYFEADPTDL